MTYTRREVSFYSEGERLAGELYVPDDGRRHPGIVLVHGLSGLRWASTYTVTEWLATRGYVVLSFDWRGCTDGPSEPRTVDPFRVSEDVRSGITFLEHCTEVADGRVSLVGQSFGGGVALYVAALDPRVRAVVAINPFTDGHRWLEAIRTREQWDELTARIRSDQARRVRSGDDGETIPNLAVLMPDRYEEVAASGEPGSTVVNLRLESLDAIMRFKPEELVHLIAPRAVAFVHAEPDELIPTRESEAAYVRAREPKRLDRIPVASHMDMYGPFDQGTFERTMIASAAWLEQHA